MAVLLISIAIIGVICGSDTIAEILPPTLEHGMKERSNYFNVELFQRLSESQTRNVLIGTSSVKSALMVLAEAAHGTTRNQILSSLRIPDYEDKLKKAANATLVQYRDTTGFTELSTANKLWTSKDVMIKKNYIDLLQARYKGEVESVDFTKTNETIKTINDWIKKTTHGRINSLADPGSINGATKLLLTTAVYFKGKWKYSFNENDTRLTQFHVPNSLGGSQKVPMMENVQVYKYGFVNSLDSYAVLIPYTGDRIGMLVILPRVPGNDALAGLQRDLAFAALSRVISDLRETEILLQLPRFSLKAKINNVQSVLNNLRITDLFNDNANLSGAFEAGINVKVGGFVHNAQIEVNEEGTIAAAVSEVSVIPLIGSSIVTFRADRPFLFFLMDMETSGILFAGRYYQPNEPTMAKTKK